jgi:hypothetical protein
LCSGETSVSNTLPAAPVFGSSAAKNHTVDARVHQRTGAHHARLQRHVQGRGRKAVVAEALAGVAQRHDFGMRARVVARDAAVPAFADDFAIGDQQRADRHFGMFFLRMARQFQRAQHEAVIVRAE